MTGKQNFQRAIGFSSPAYLPNALGVDFDYLRDKNETDTAYLKSLIERMPKDLLNFLWVWKDHWYTADGKTHNHDEWGTDWVDDGHGCVTCGYPLEQGYEKLKGYTFPDVTDLSRFQRPDELIARYPDRYLVGTVWFTLFERLWMLRGMENLFTDPYDHPEDFAALKERVVQTNLAMIEQWCKRDVDAVFFSDDLGGQSSLLISPGHFREHYYNDYKRMFRAVRDGGKQVWLHACGNITAILPDLIDLGVQVINPVQPQAMDVRALARDFGGKICFNGGIDVQGTLIHGTPEQIKRELHTLIDLFGCYDGGYIVNTSHSIMPETPLRNVIVLHEEYLRIIGA